MALSALNPTGLLGRQKNILFEEFQIVKAGSANIQQEIFLFNPGLCSGIGGAGRGWLAGICSGCFVFQGPRASRHIVTGKFPPHAVAGPSLATPSWASRWHFAAAWARQAFGLRIHYRLQASLWVITRGCAGKVPLRRHGKKHRRDRARWFWRPGPVIPPKPRARPRPGSRSQKRKRNGGIGGLCFVCAHFVAGGCRAWFAIGCGPPSWGEFPVTTRRHLPA